MSKVKDCPNCGAHNCVGERTALNYCMWCGYSFKAEKNTENLIVDCSTGQTSLFEMDTYRISNKWNGGI